MKRVPSAAMVFALVLATGAATAMLVPLTGGTGDTADADRDGWADAAETALATPAGRTPAETAGASAAGLLESGGAAGAENLTTAEAFAAGGLALAADAAAGAAETAAGAASTAAASARAPLAETAAKARAAAPEPARPVVDAVLSILDLGASEAGATGAESLEAAASATREAAADVRASSAPAFAAGRAAAPEAAGTAGNATQTLAAAADAMLQPAAAFAYETEPRTALISGEDASGLPATGVWVDVDSDGERRADRTEDLAITDADGDRYADRVEILAGANPAHPGSTPDDLDDDNSAADAELAAGLRRFSVTPGAAGASGAAATLATGRSVTTAGVAVEGTMVTVTTAEANDNATLGARRLSACGGDAASCAFDPDRDGQTTTNEILLNGDPTDPASTGPGGPLPPTSAWPQADAIAAARTAALLSDDLFAALQVA